MRYIPALQRGNRTVYYIYITRHLLQRVNVKRRFVGAAEKLNTAKMAATAAAVFVSWRIVVEKTMSTTTTGGEYTYNTIRATGEPAGRQLDRLTAPPGEYNATIIARSRRLSPNNEISISAWSSLRRKAKTSSSV